MKNTLNLSQESYKIIMLMVIYVVLLLVVSIIKSNILISALPVELVKTAKISSYVSITISSVISAIALVSIIGLLYFVNNVFELNVDEDNLISSFDNSILVLITFETIKFLFAYFTLENELMGISFSDNFLEEIRLTNWYYADNIMLHVMIFLASATYAITLKSRHKACKLSTLAFFSITLLLGFYFSTINIFDSI